MKRSQLASITDAASRATDGSHALLSMPHTSHATSAEQAPDSAGMQLQHVTLNK